MERYPTGMIALVAKTFEAGLAPDERDFYHNLRPEWKAPFRILRDLATTGIDGYGPSYFFMSCEQLRLRLGLKHVPQAERILKRFQQMDIIIPVDVDKRKTREATTYCWRFPLPLKKAA